MDKKRISLVILFVVFITAVIFFLAKNSLKPQPTNYTPVPTQKPAPKDYVQAKPVDSSNCKTFIPPTLQLLKRSRYQTTYSLNSSAENSIWEATSQPSTKFSLESLPEVFLVYNLDNSFQGCGVSQTITNEKAQALEKEMKLIQCDKEKRYFSSGKEKDDGEIFQILTPDSKQHSLRYEPGIKVNQEDILCR